MNGKRVLAGDVGGTKTLLQIVAFEGPAKAPRVIAEGRFASQEYDEIAPMVREFLALHGREGIERACFGVAGPVFEEGGVQRASLTNLPWRLDTEQLGADLGLRAVRLLNDFEAIGYGIDGLEKEDLITLQPGPARPGGARVVIGAGTGLGVAWLCRCGDRYEVHPTEGGHLDFGPTDDEEIELLRWLRVRYGRVSYERVVSGMGIEDIYRFLLERDGMAEDEILRAPDVGAAVSAAAFQRGHRRAERTLAIFVRAYGSAAGNYALAGLAHGGVYIAGGIAPKILPLMREGPFMEAFNRKGRMTPLTAAMPVYLITNPKVGLIGAALTAGRL